MRINTALILCAGYGKRLNPVTFKTPKPLIKIDNISMLEKCINLIEKIGIQKILINTFYLKNQFSEFLNNKRFNLNIKIIEDGENILDTGGGIQNMIKNYDENGKLKIYGNCPLEPFSYNQISSEYSKYNLDITRHPVKWHGLPTPPLNNKLPYNFFIY